MIGLGLGVSPCFGSGAVGEAPTFASLTNGGSAAFPQDNNFDTGADRLVLAQDASSGWFNMFTTANLGSLFVIARRSIAATYENTSYFLLDGIDNGTTTRQCYLQMRGGAYGTTAQRNVLNGRCSTSGTVPNSAEVDEDAFLAVLYRNASNQSVIDWYSLADGTKHAGTPSGTISQQMSLPSDTTGYEFYVGGDEDLTAGGQKDWPGDIQAIGYVQNAVSDATWQSIALGEPLEDALTTANVLWVREFDGSTGGLAKPSWATSDATAGTSVKNGSLAVGSDLRRASQTSYLTVNEKTDGYVYGLIPAETSRSVTFSGKSAGRTGNVEVQIAYQATGEVLVDWTSLGAVSADWSGSATIPKCSKGWVVALFRTTDDTDVITYGMRKFGVGYKFLQLGQSQTQIYLTNATRGDDPTNKNHASYVTSDVATAQPVVQQHTLINTRTSDGLSAFVDQFQAYEADTPLAIIDAAIVGTGPDQLMDDSNATRDWSTLQAKLDTWGNDVSAVLMNWATQGWETNGTVAETMEALIYGTGSYSGTIDHNLTAALRAGFAFGLSPATRHTTLATHATVRAEQVAYAHAQSLVVGLPVCDYEIESAGGPHPNNSELGNRVFAVRQAHLAAKCMGLTVPLQPYFTTAVRSGDTITVSTNLPNGGTLSSPAPSAIRNFEVDEGGGYTDTGFSAAISGNTVVLTRDSGTWAADTKVKYLINGSTRAASDTTEEAAIVDGMLYETQAADILGLGIPVAGALSGGNWMPDWEVTATG